MAQPVLSPKDFADRPRTQLWRDALTFRQMATEDHNNSLRSMCVRNAVLTAWTTLQMACCDALEIAKINRFKDDLKAAIKQAGKTPIDFGSGLWKDILEILQTRNDYVHRGIIISERFPPVSVAEEAVKTIRNAIKDIYVRTGKNPPRWVDLDTSRGWPQTRGIGIRAHLTVFRGVMNDPNAVNISLVTPAGQEKETIVLPPNTPEEDILDEVEQLLGNLNVHRTNSSGGIAVTTPTNLCIPCEASVW
jgi:hypothetical protein